MATVHVKFRDQSHDFELSSLFPQDRLSTLGISDSNVTVESISDVQIKRAVADHLDVSSNEFNNYSVERHPNGNATIRPQAEFGR